MKAMEYILILITLISLRNEKTTNQYVVYYQTFKGLYKRTVAYIFLLLSRHTVCILKPLQLKNLIRKKLRI